MTGAVTTLLLPWLAAAVLAVGGVLVPLAYARGLAWLRAHALDTTIYEAIGRAGGVSYRALLASGQPATSPAALQQAAEAGGRYLMARVPEALAARGVAPEAAAELPGAELGRLLAADPTVAPGPGRAVASP